MDIFEANFDTIFLNGSKSKLFMIEWNLTILGISIKKPEKVATSLAEFVYNLTTCPIPREETKRPYR